MKTYLLCAALGLMAASAPAKKFSDAPVGQGEATVGSTVGADYTSLLEAAQDFNSISGGLTGNATLTITSDLTESVNIAFGNLTNGHTFTIRPAATAATEPVVVTLNSNTAITGDFPSYGHIRFGSPNLNTAFGELVAMPNIVIDGTRGGTGRHLKFLVPSSVTINSGTLRFLGDCDNAVVKGCIIENYGGSAAATFCFGIVITGNRLSTGVDMVAQNFEISNNAIIAKGGGDARGILTQFVAQTGHAITSGHAHTGVINNNDFSSRKICVQIQQFATGSINNNRMEIDQTFTGNAARPTVIDHKSSNFATGWTLEIANNQIGPMTWAPTEGHLGAISVGMTPANGSGTYNIINNIIGGYSYTGASQTGQSIMRCIALEGAGSTCNLNIFHNSISMANQANMNQSTVAVDRYNAISIHNIDYAGTLNLRNNIIRNEDAKGAIIYKNTGGTGTFTSDNNTFWYGATGKMASFNQAGTAAPNYNTLNNWQTGALKDANSNAENPFAPASGGKWISQTNLRFDDVPAATFQGTNALGITTDIDGALRPNPPTKGADEYAPNAGIADWQLM